LTTKCGGPFPRPRFPVQPGADTSLGQELRDQRYPASTERSPFKAMDPMMTSQNGKSVYGTLLLPANIIFN
jgi:hypothetical protein